MRIVFFGSSEFAKESLNALCKRHHNILAVCTLPGVTPVNCFAQDLRLNLIQPENILSDKAKRYLAKLAPDIFVVVAYGKIFDNELLNIPRLYSINLHGSLLPEYRGAAPIHWAIIHGATVTGVTVFKISERVDSGDIILQKKVPLTQTDDSVTLSDELSRIGSGVLGEAIELIETGKVVFMPQDEAKASYAPKLKKNDGLIDWSKDSSDIYNQMRGTLPWPGAFTFWKGKRIKIYKSEIKYTTSDVKKRYGEVVIIDNSSIVVNTGNGALSIKELQLEGGRRMGSYEFSLGHNLKIGDILCRN